MTFRKEDREGHGERFSEFVDSLVNSGIYSARLMVAKSNEAINRASMDNIITLWSDPRVARVLIDNEALDGRLKKFNRGPLGESDKRVVKITRMGRNEERRFFSVLCESLLDVENPYAKIMVAESSWRFRALRGPTGASLPLAPG